MAKRDNGAKDGETYDLTICVHKHPVMLLEVRLGFSLVDAELRNGGLRRARGLRQDPVTRVLCKAYERQKQILRLTTPELKNVRGPVRVE